MTPSTRSTVSSSRKTDREGFGPPVVSYEVVYEGRTLDWLPAGSARALIERAKRNPGIVIIAQVYDKAEDKVLSRQQVYPVPSTA